MDGDMLTVTAQNANQHFGTAALPGDIPVGLPGLQLTTLILATAAAIFVVPPMSAAVDFYHGHLKKRCGFLGQPPRAPMLFAWAFLANVFLLLSTIWYLYNEAGLTAADDITAAYYITVESLIMVVIALKYVWKGLVWNLYDRTWAMVLALIISVAVPLLELVLTILMGIRNVWVSMAFMLLVFLINVPMPFWTYVIYTFFKEAPRRRRRKTDETT